MTRRTPGGGSIDQLPSGRWRVRLSTSGGKRVTLTASTHGEAEELRRGALAELLDGNLAPVGGVTLRSWGPGVLDARELAGGRNSPTERSIWRRHLLTAEFIDWPLANVRPRDVRAWVASLQKKRSGRPRAGQRPGLLDRGTVKHALDLLRKILEAAVLDEVIPENPAAGVEAPAGQSRPDEPWTYLSPEEQVRLLGCPEIPAWGRLLIALALGTGVRQGELWNLELRDTHLDHDTPHIVVRFGSRGRTTKGGRTRIVPLFGLALEAMRQWLALLPTFARHNPHGLVCPTERGCRRQRSKAPRGWAAWLRAARVERPVRWHDLRHTCASSLLAGWWGHRWTLEQVRDLLGHRSVTTTERYAHLAPSVLAETAARTDLGRSREGHGEIIRNLSASPQRVDFTRVLVGRATHDSNVRPSAPETGAKYLGFSAVTPSRDQAVTAAAIAFLQAVAAGEGGVLLADLARGLAVAVLEIPEVVLAKRIQAALVSRSPLLISIATQLAERLLNASAIEASGEERVG